MKRLCSLFLAIIISLSCVAALAAVEIPDELPVGIMNASAKLYKTTSTKNGTVTTLKADTEIEIIGETKSFYRVVSDNRAGYVLKKYITLSEDDQETSSSSSDNLGTRKNPAEVGETITLNINSSFYGIGTLKMELVSVTRGSAAYQQIVQWNMFNSAPSEGTEYALLYFKVTFEKDASGIDKGYEINLAQFDHADKTFAVDDQYVSAVLNPPLRYQLYEGSVASGYIIMECKPGEDSYAIYMDTAWFKF